MDAEYEIVFVVEGRDSTLDRVRTLAENNPRIKIDYTPDRLGLGKALKKGLSLVGSDSDLVLTMDADLNHDPEEIRSLLEATRDADVVVGYRSRSHGFVQELPLFKRVISASTNWLLRKTFRIDSSDVTNGFRIYSAKSVRSVRDELTAKNFEVTAEILIRIKKKGFKIAEVPISFTRRPRGTSKLSFVKSGIGYFVLFLRLGL